MDHPPRDSRTSAKHPAATDDDLALRAVAGEREALNQLLARHEDRARRIARIRMGKRVRSFLESQDVVQDAFLVVAQSIGGFKPAGPGSFVAWLSRIVENQVRDAAKYAGALKRNPDLVVELDRDAGTSRANQQEPADRGARPSEIAMDLELRDAYDASVAELPEDMREVVLLRDYASEEWETIAKSLRRDTVSAARQLYRRARIRLARQLSERLGAGGDAP